MAVAPRIYFQGGVSEVAVFQAITQLQLGQTREWIFFHEKNHDMLR